MSISGAGDSRQSKNQRREAAREKATQLREQQRKKDVRNRVVLISSLSVVAIAIVVGVALVLTSAFSRTAGPGPLNMASDGIQINAGLVATQTPALAAGEEPVPTETDPASGVVDIRTYVDYLCPFCGQFEATNNEQMTEWIESGAATVEVHPLSILDRASLGTRYSTRAANAASCVANYSPDQFWAFNGLLFENQPAENSEGLDDAALKELATEAGVTAQSDIDTCIDDAQFRGFVADATSRALQDPLPGTDTPVEGTPTVLVNGQKYEGSITDADAFAAFVVQVAGEAYDTSTTAPTATSTPTATPAP